jgi:hypothetical protein
MDRKPHKSRAPMLLDAVFAGHPLSGPTPDEAMPATELAARLQVM